MEAGFADKCAILEKLSARLLDVIPVFVFVTLCCRAGINAFHLRPHHKLHTTIASNTIDLILTSCDFKGKSQITLID